MDSGDSGDGETVDSGDRDTVIVTAVVTVPQCQ